MLYWAYGSNLDQASMAQRCPLAKRVGPLTLKNGVLIFRSVADVIRCEGHVVHGGVWRITPRCEAALDRYEGYLPDAPKAGLYNKRYITLSVNGGDPEDCMYYVMNKRKHQGGIMPPPVPYLNVIKRGYKWFGLDMNSLDAALRNSYERKYPTPYLRDRHLRKGRPALAPIDALSDLCG